jgi:hypothetical protein
VRQAVRTSTLAKTKSIFTVMHFSLGPPRNNMRCTSAVPVASSTSLSRVACSCQCLQCRLLLSAHSFECELYGGLESYVMQWSVCQVLRGSKSSGENILQQSDMIKQKMRLKLELMEKNAALQNSSGIRPEPECKSVNEFLFASSAQHVPT